MRMSPTCLQPVSSPQHLAYIPANSRRGAAMPSTNGHEPERVALYLRVSSEEQRDRETIELQDDFLDQYCNLHELEVTDVYEDNGVSGTIPVYERPEGRRLLEDAKGGGFGALLVYRLDRLGRSLLVIVDAHNRLEEA